MEETKKGINKLIPIFIVILLLIGGGSFYGGMKYQSSKSSSVTMGQQVGNFPGGNQNGSSKTGTRTIGGGMVNGEITAKDDKSITVKLKTGGSKIVLLSDSTAINKSTTGAKNDLEVGKSVMVTGTTNTDGSVTAKSVQIPQAGQEIGGGTPPDGQGAAPTTTTK